MSAVPMWQSLGPIQAGHSTVDLHRSSGFIFRIRHETGEMSAPSWPTAIRAGVLWRRPAAAVFAGNPAAGVRVDPMSATRR